MKETREFCDELFVMVSFRSQGVWSSLDLIKELMNLNPLDAVLVSKLGSVQTQFGKYPRSKIYVSRR